MVEAVQVQYGEGDTDGYMHLSLKPFASCAQHRQALGSKGGQFQARGESQGFVERKSGLLVCTHRRLFADPNWARLKHV